MNAQSPDRGGYQQLSGCRIIKPIFLVAASWLCRNHLKLVSLAERFIYFTGDPQTVHHHCQFPRDRNDRSFPGVLAATFHEAQTPSAKIGLRPKTPQHVLGTVNQEAPQEAISRFRDRKLG